MQTKYKLFIFLLLICCAGCNKNGEIIQPDHYGILTIKLEYAVDAENVYRIELQDQLFADSISYAEDQKKVVNEKKYIITQEKKHFVIFDQDGLKLMDTSLILENRDNITLIQIQSGAAPVILDASLGGSEPDPRPGSTKVRFTYDDPLLPDSVELKIFSCAVTDMYSLFDYSYDPAPHLFTDSAMLKAYKGKFSEYIQLDCQKYTPATPAYIIGITDLKTGEVIQQVQLIDYWFVPGNTTQMSQCGNDLVPFYKFFNLKLNKWIQSGISTGDMTVFQDGFMYGVPW